MKALLAATVLLALLVVVPAADARPPQPGADCDVKEEYVTEAAVTEAAVTKDANDLPVVVWGAPRPIECYY